MKMYSFYSSGGWNIKDQRSSKVQYLGEHSSWLVEDHLLTLSSHNTRVSSRVSSSFIRTPVLPDKGSALMISFNLGPTSNIDILGWGEYVFNRN